MSVELPERYRMWVERLSAPAWRERKQATTVLRELVELDVDKPEVLEAVAEHLLDGLVSKEAINGRAACHEVLVAIGPRATAGLLRRLDQPGTGQRLLVDLLGEIGDPSHAGCLARIVTDRAAETNLRGSAAVALGKLGGTDAAAALESLLGDPTSMLRVHALEALRSGGLQVPLVRATTLLIDPYTRKAAAAVLGNSARIEAAALLVPLLEDDMAGVRATAAVSLVRIDTRLEGADEIAAMLRRVSPQARSHIRGLLDNRALEVRVAAIKLAGLAGDSEIVPLLLSAMDDPILGEQALLTAACLGEDAAKHVLAAKSRTDERSYHHLLRLIGALRPPVDGRLLVLLTESLVGTDDDRAIAAAEALERVGGRSCLAELCRALQHPGRRGESAADAIVAILRREDALEELERCVDQPWPQQGCLAANLCRVVGELGSQLYTGQLVAMLGSPDVQVRVAAAGALGQVEGEHEGAGALAFALADEEPQVRAAACRSLGQLKAAGSVQPLASATEDRSPMVRAAAVQALVALDNPVGLARLRAVIAEDPVPSVVVQAIVGLGCSGLEQDLTMLMSLCTSDDWEVVKAAARALLHFPEHRATAALLGLLDHARWDVRWAAAEVLAARADLTALASLRRALPAEQDRVVRKVIRDAIAKLESLR